MMLRPDLPPQLISLVHHVELNKSGWFDHALSRFLMAALWLSAKPITITEMRSALYELCRVSLDDERATAHIERLVKNGAAVRLPTGQYKLSEPTLAQLTRDLEIAETIEGDVRKRFNDAVLARCPTLSTDDVWRRFTEIFLLPFVRETGARTYELVSAAHLEITRTISFGHFLQRYPEALRGPLQEAIVAFLDPKHPAVRTYIFRHLNAYFLMEASSLTDDALRAVVGLVGKAPNITLFLDTNFLFSALALHDNPGNEAALQLLGLIRALPETVKVKMYVSPLTLDETKRTITGYRDSLKNLRLTPNVADAMRRGQLSGIAMRFAQECVRLNRTLSADDYFAPYVGNLVDVLRSKGIELYNEDMDRLRAAQEIIDDLNDEIEFEKRYGERAKTYEQLLHDVTLWHFVKRKRPVRVESPLDARYWITTIDFRFLGFDSFKHRARVIDVPVVVHPAALTQMLQFWLPRTPEFEEAVVASIKYPIFFYEYDINAERTTIRILEALGRFQGVEDVPKETIARVLVNQVLRQKLSHDVSVQDRVELVRDAIVAETATLREELADAKAAASRLAGEVSERDKRLVEARAAAEAAGRLEAEATAALQEERERTEALERRIVQLERQSTEAAQASERAGERRLFLLRWMLGGMTIAVISGGLAAFVLAGIGRQGLLSRREYWSVTTVVWGLIVMAWAGWAERVGAALPGVREWGAFTHIRNARRWIFGTLWTIVLGAVGNAVYDFFVRHRGAP